MFRKGSLSPTSRPSNFSRLVNKYQALDNSESSNVEHFIATHGAVSSSNVSAMALDLGNDVIAAANKSMNKECSNVHIGSKAAPSFLPAISSVSGPGNTYAQWNLGTVRSASPSRNAWRQRHDI